MSSKTRNAEKRREREEQAIRDEEENNRLANRTMYERIEDAKDVHDLREILHEISDRVDALDKL